MCFDSYKYGFDPKGLLTCAEEVRTRLIGIVIEGVDSRQIFWLGAESLSALVFGTIYFSGGNRTT